MQINWLLLGVLVVIAICVYHGYRVGLVRMGYSIATFLVAAVLVRFLAPVGAQMLKNNETFYQTVRTPIEHMLDHKMEQSDGFHVMDLRTDNYIPVSVVTEIYDKITDMTGEKPANGVTPESRFASTVKDVTADYLTLWAIDIIVYIVLFLVLNVGLRVLGIVLDYLSKLPGIKGVNKLAGSLVGVVEGVVFVWLCFLIITIFQSTAWGSWCFEQIRGSFILSILYMRNIFLMFV